jgi:hypothetical protein
MAKPVKNSPLRGNSLAGWRGIIVRRPFLAVRVVLVLSLLTAAALFQSCLFQRVDDRLFSITAEELKTVKLAYYSDYFSFIGSDDAGTVGFALDNNRGRDGDSFQAEHFVVLHDDKTGWQSVAGNGFYENAARQLDTIPDSSFFSFKGAAQEGFEITSEPNALALKTAPMHIHISRTKGIAQYRLGSAGATLEWGDRRLKGRVIHEYLFLPAFNRLTRKYVDAFDDFRGVYASVGNEGDLYFHTQKSEAFFPLIEPREGFLFLDGKRRLFSSLKVRALDTSFAWGFYRWPMSLSGEFEAGSDRYDFAVHVTDKKTIRNWVIGGFSMGILKGRMVSPLGTYTLSGLGEFIL